jgi:hypothetical protein
MYSSFPDGISGNAALFNEQNIPSDPGMSAASDDSWLTTHPFDSNANGISSNPFASSSENTSSTTDSESNVVGELEQMLSRIAGMLPALLPSGSSQGTSSALTGAQGNNPCSNFNTAQFTNGGQYAGGAQFTNGSNGVNPGQNQTEFTNFQASSVGDPHDSFSGAGSSGQAVSSHWDSMQSHHDLLDSSSFADGFRVSSSVTSPQSNGTTMNGTVDIHTNNGRDDIRYSANGNVGVEQDGSWETLAAGSSLVLGDGTKVVDNAQNQLTVSKSNSSGGSISTTLTSNGQGGVDMQASGQNVQVGGYLVDSGAGDTQSSAWS